MDNRTQEQLAQWVWSRYDAGFTHKEIVTEYNETHNETFTTGWVGSLKRRYPKQKRVADAVSLNRLDKQDTDIDYWNEELKELKHNKRFIRFAHLTDMHRPYQDVAAVELAYQMLDDFQPDVIPVGLDDIDLPLISSYEPDPDMQMDDWIINFADLWHTYIDELEAVAPDAMRPYIVGNHNERAFKEMDKSNARRTLYKLHANMVRSDGRVFYFGNIGELKIDTLIFRHKPCSTKHASYSTLDDDKFQHYLVCGHIHRPFETEVMVEYPRAAWITACLCDLKPHYDKQKEYSKWQHGIGLFTLDTHTGIVSGRNYTFRHTDDAIWCDTLNRRYMVKKD